MYRAEAAIPVKIRREGRRTTIVQANVRDEGGLVSITTKQSDGWWGAIIVGKRATFFAFQEARLGASLTAGVRWSRASTRC